MSDDKPEKRQLQKPAGATDYLANERTFLAWIRTGIALMGLGFVIVKFVLFIRQFSTFLGVKTSAGGTGFTAVVGVIIVALGGFVAVFAFFRYRSIEKQLDNQNYFPSKWLVIMVSAVIFITSFLLMLYLMLSV